MDQAYEQLQRTPEPLHPSLVSTLITHRLGRKGDLPEAIAWANTLRDPKEQASAKKALTNEDNLNPEELEIVSRTLNY